MTIIHGILSYDGNPSAEANMQAMLQSTAHFADAGSGYIKQGRMLLGSNLLKTLPSGRHEINPVLTDLASGMSIVATARIDNRDELFSLLGVERRKRKELSDVELILKAFQK